jgi:predicted translin family RNA/ssDNA-binding protein
MSYFKEDSPDFRKTLQDYEETVTELSQVFKEWTEKAAFARDKGKEYCSAMKNFYASIEEKSRSQVLLTYYPYLRSICDALHNILDCDEEVVKSLDEVFSV